MMLVRLDLNLVVSLFQHKCEVSETVSTTTLAGDLPPPPPPPRCPPGSPPMVRFTNSILWIISAKRYICIRSVIRLPLFHADYFVCSLSVGQYYFVDRVEQSAPAKEGLRATKALKGHRSPPKYEILRSLL